MYWLLLKFTHDAIITVLTTILVCFYLMPWLYEKLIEDFKWELYLIKEFYGWEEKRNDGKKIA